jgi:hypothetical protein
MADDVNAAAPAAGGEAVKALAHRLWSVHPREIQDMGITREQFYEAEISKLIAATPAVGGEVSADDLGIVLSALRYLEEVTGEKFDDDGGISCRIERLSFNRPAGPRLWLGYFRSQSD